MERSVVSGYNTQMDQKKKAVQVALMGVGLVAALMVGFYYFKDRLRTGENEIDFSAAGKEEAPKGEKSEFVGIYSPDSALEAEGKRITLFVVNRAEDGGYLGSAKVDTIGTDQSVFFRCVDVRIEEQDFFLKCLHEQEGSISLNGKWMKNSGAVEVEGKVLWSYQNRAILEGNRKFFYSPE